MTTLTIISLAVLLTASAVIFVRMWQEMEKLKQKVERVPSCSPTYSPERVANIITDSVQPTFVELRDTDSYLHARLDGQAGKIDSLTKQLLDIEKALEAKTPDPSQMYLQMMKQYTEAVQSIVTAYTTPVQHPPVYSNAPYIGQYPYHEEAQHVDFSDPTDGFYPPPREDAVNVPGTDGSWRNAMGISSNPEME